jgi:hypothetical protein
MHMAKKSTSTHATVLPSASAKPTDVIPIPPTTTFNQGLSSASEGLMLEKFGIPGQKTVNCSPVTGGFRNRIKTVTVEPIRVTGLDIALTRLQAALSDAEQQIPDVVAGLKTAGMLCVRRKHNSNSFSNHSWGTAIDLFLGARVIDQGVHKTYRGILQLAPFFNHHGFYWGAGFSGGSVDSMHFELAAETIRASS